VNRKMSDGARSEYQEMKKMASRRFILAILRDGEWHPYSEFLATPKKEFERTHKKHFGLSAPVLSKHFKELKRFIEKKESETDARIVCYRAKEPLKMLFKQSFLIEYSWKNIKEEFLKTKNPLSAMEKINALATMNMMEAFRYFKDLNLTIDIYGSETVRLFLETFVWEAFKVLTWNLVKESMKFIDDKETVRLIDQIDLAQIIKNIMKESEA
jgi:hypothetical protein